jgi:hypothetical protein
MKTLILTTLMLTFTAPAFSKTITITGLRAKALIAIGDATQSTEGSMGGRIDMELRNVKCVKTVDDKFNIYLQSCSFSAFEDVVISSDQETNRYTPEEFRTALREITKNEIQVSDVKKTIDVDLIKCHGAGIGHTLDALNIEQTFKCTLIIK